MDFFEYVPYSPQYSVKPGNLMAAVIYNRLSFLKSTITEISGQLKQRDALWHRQSREIDENLCRAQSKAYQFEPDHPAANNLEKMIIGLHKEKRNLELACFQGTVELRRELRITEKELIQALLDLWIIQFLKTPMSY